MINVSNQNIDLGRETPIACDETEKLADWIECQAIFSSSKQCSRITLARALRRNGTLDTVLGEDDDDASALDADSRLSMRVADDAFGEIENRGLACGGAYPFIIDSFGIKLKPIDLTDSNYVFLLLLTKLGPTTGHAGTAALFEHLCSHAACYYLGGAANRAQVVRVGAPRKTPLTTFQRAVDDMCIKLKEGGGCKPSPRRARSTGDGKLDIVAWREFPADERRGKLIAFGQCAAGQSGWQDKLSELDPRNFVKKFLRESLVVDPIRLFFVPWRVNQEEWDDISADAGIVFDRSRLVGCLENLSKDLAKQRKLATKVLLSRGKGPPKGPKKKAPLRKLPVTARGRR